MEPEFVNASAPMGRLGASASALRLLTHPTRRGATFAILMVAELFYSWAWNTVDVLRPYFRSDLGLSLMQAGSAYSAQGAGALCGAVLIGQLADRLGRRRVLPVVMVGYGVMLIVGNWVANYSELLAQRFLLGIFLGGVFPVVVGIYVDLFDQGIRGRLASVLNAIFSGAIVALGVSASQLASSNWRTLLWIGGLPPIALAFAAVVIIPNTITSPRIPNATQPELPLVALFSRVVRRQTLLLTAIVGLNFFAYQAFSGWLTVYLTDDLHLSPGWVGSIVATQFTGNVLGCFVWGWVGDRFGRKANAWGLAACAFSSLLFLIVRGGQGVVGIIGFCYGFTLSSSVIWGPWITELYPAHLRSTAASIFHWGRLVSFFAPFATASLAGAFGLRIAMMIAGVTFLAAAGIWSLLPETLVRRKPAEVAI